jgi:hypothetical protein
MARARIAGSSCHPPDYAGRLFADMKREFAIYFMGIRRHHVPLHLVGTGLQWRQRNPHDRPVPLIDMRVGLVDLLAGGITDDSRAEFWLQPFVEFERDFTWRVFDGALLRRGCADEMGMCER